MNTFPCTSCGACCKHIDRSIDNAIKLSELTGNKDIIFPFTHSDGVCEKLIDNKCSIYDNRPLLCNVEKMREVLGYSKKYFYKLNLKVCNELIKEAGLDESFSINL